MSYRQYKATGFIETNIDPAAVAGATLYLVRGKMGDDQPDHAIAIEDGARLRPADGELRGLLFDDELFEADLAIEGFGAIDKTVVVLSLKDGGSATAEARVEVTVVGASAEGEA